MYAAVSPIDTSLRNSAYRQLAPHGNYGGELASPAQRKIQKTTYLVKSGSSKNEILHRCAAPSHEVAICELQPGLSLRIRRDGANDLIVLVDAPNIKPYDVYAFPMLRYELVKLLDAVV